MSLTWLPRKIHRAESDQTSRRARSRIDRAIRSCFEQLETRRLLDGANPVADPGGPYTVNEGSSLSINGSGSSDADGSIVAYKWDLNYVPEQGFRTSITGVAFTYHAVDGPLNRTIALRVTDNSGNVTTQTTTLTINNVQPTINLTGLDSLAEGQTYTLNWSKSDPGQDTITGWEIDWGDGSDNSLVAANVSTASRVYDTPGTPTISVTATDEDGTTTQTKNITVTTVNPVVSLLGDFSVDEGSLYTIFFSSTDAGGDTRDGWIIDWGDGEIVFTDASLTSSSHTYVDNGSHTVTATALASDGDTGGDSINLTVNNVAPSVTITGTPDEDVVEGTELTFGSSVSDPGSDSLTYGWTVWKDGEHFTVPNDTVVDAANFTFTPTDNGTYRVRLTVLDDDGGSTTVNSDEFTVTNAAPTASISGEPQAPITEGDTVSLTVTPADAGDDTFSYSWSVTRNGQAFELPVDAVRDEAGFSFIPTDEGTYVAEVVVSDDDGDHFAVSSEDIAVVNDDPAGSISGEPEDPVAEGSSVNLTANASDPGAEDALLYSWSVTRNGEAFELPEDAVSNEYQFSFVPTDEGTYVATVVVSDEDGGEVTLVSSDITAENANPTGDVSGAPDASPEGSAITLSVSAADAGSADTVSYSWAVTRNGQPFDLPNGAVTDEADFTFTPTDNGTYVATVTLTDNDGGTVDVSSDDIVVSNVAPTVGITNLPQEDVVEGTEISVGSSVSDAGDEDTLTYGWTVWKDGEHYILPNDTVIDEATFAFTPTDNGSFVIRLTVEDDDGGSTTYNSPAITVTNANPTVGISGEPNGAIDEGDAISLTATPADAGEDDTFTYAWSTTRDGQAYALPEGTDTSASTLNFTTTDNGEYVFTVTVTDDDGGEGSASSEAITVNNVDPAGVISGEPEDPIAEGSQVDLTVAVTDAGEDDLHSYEWTVTKNGDPYALPEFAVTDNASFSFIVTDNGTYVATVLVTDDDGGADTIISQDIVVTNVAPTATISGEPEESISEGDSVTLTAAPADAGADDTFTYSWSVTRNGQAFNLPIDAVTDEASFTFIPTDEGTYVASVVVTDDDGEDVSAQSGDIIVTNAAPVVAITGAPQEDVSEGTELTFGSTVTDAGEEDTVASYAWSVTLDGDAFALPNDAVTDEAGFTFTPTDNGEYVVTLTVADNDGAETTTTAGFTAVNVAPTATVSGEPNGTIQEGTAVNLAVTPADAGADDTFTYAWSVTKDGESYALPENAITTDDQFSFTPTDNGTYVATVIVSDDDGASVSASSEDIVVTNANPTASISGEPEDPIAEGSTVNLSAAATDPGADDTLGHSWSVARNGQPFELPEDAVTNESDFSFVATDNGTYVATVVVTDDDGGSTSVDSDDITVTNANPTGSISVDPTGNRYEGSAIHLAVAPADAGAEDTFTYSWSVTKDGQAYDLPNDAVTDEAEFSFIPTDDGDYVATVTLTDDDGGSVQVSTDALEVLNTNPQPTITGAPAEVAEGTTINLGSEVLDAGDDDTIASYAWSVTRDGQAFDLPNDVATDEATFSFVPTDNGMYAITLTVTDDDGGSDFDSVQIQVTNANPTASISGEPNGAIGEGDTVTLTVTPADAGSEDTFTYSWNVTRDGEPYVLPENAVTDEAEFSFVPTDNGTYVAQATVTDDDGGEVLVTSQEIIVNNVNPTASITGAPFTTIDEGDSVTLTAVPGDAGAEDTFSYSWSVSRNGQAFELPEDAVTDEADFTFTATDNGDYTATVVVTDDDGGSVSVDSIEISAGNVAPAGQIAGAPEASPEGTAITLTAVPSDPGSEDTFTYSWTVTKDGQAYNLPNDVSTTQASLTFVPADEGEYVAHAAVTDDDGGSVELMTAAINVTNAAPDVTITGGPEGAIDEGDAVSLGTDVSDPGSEDTIASYNWSVTKDGQAYALPNDAETDGENFSFTPIDNGEYVVTCVVTDNDGGETIKTRTITVNNANPTASITGAPNGAVDEGDSLSLGVSASDAGANDTLSYLWSVLRNGEAFELPGDAVVDETSFTFIPTDDGSYVVSVSVTDNDGGSVNVETDAITVDNVNPAGTISGEPEGSINESDSVTLTVAASDVGAEDSLTYAWTVTKDGQAYSLADTTTNESTLTFTANDEGTYVATVVVADDDGGETSISSGEITVNNVAPTGSITGAPETSEEGAEITLSTDASDVGATDELTYAWMVTKDGQPYTDGNERDFTIPPDDNGEYIVSLTVSDNDGGSTEIDPVTVNVTNVTPTVTLEEVPESAVEGDNIVIDVETSDPGTLDTDAGIEIAWTVTRNGEAFVSGAGNEIDFTPDDDGEYTISVSGTDKDDSAGIDTGTLTVSNSIPTAEITGAPETSDEGALISLGSSVFDAGSADESAGFTYAWSVQRGGNVYALGEEALTNASDFSFTPGDNESYTVTLTVHDKDGAVTETSATITVTNVDPQLTLTGAPNSSPEGTTIALPGSASDVGSEDTLAYAWTVTKNGEAYAEGSSADISFTPDDNGTYVVSMTATDDDGGADSVEETIAVTNVAPTGTIANTFTGVRGRETTFAMTLADVGSADAEAVSINWGDGSSPDVIATNSSAERNFTHVYASVGTFPVTMTITDDDGGSVSVSTTVTIKAAAIQVDPMDSSKTALIVGGTSGDDSIKFSLTSTSRIKVLINGENMGTFAPTGRLIAYGDGGTNNIIADAAVTAPGVFYGGSGKDIMRGGSGDDILIGRRGNDVLIGGEGRDIVIGGVGIDSMQGDGGEDILIGGSTDSAESFTALAAISAEWSRTDSNFANRVKHLKGLSSDRLNGNYKLTDGTVFEDANADTLTGGAGRDWFFSNTSSSSVETITDLNATQDVLTNVAVGVSATPKKKA